MQPKVLAAVDEMIEHAQNTRPQIYTSYRIIVPSIVNIEANRVLFSDFQDSVSFRDSQPESDQQVKRTIENARANRAFFEKHREHLVVPETAESAAWKTFFIKKLNSVLGYQKDYPELLAKTATEIANKCNISIDTFTPEEVVSTIQGLHDRIGNTNAPRSKAGLDLEARREVINKMSEVTKDFFDSLSDKERCLIQACYLVGGFSRSLHKYNIFSDTMSDAGEYGIAEAIQTLPDEEADKTTSLVISDDIGARRMLRTIDIPDEKAPIVITDDDFLKAAQAKFAPQRLPQTPGTTGDWRSRVTINNTEDVAKFDHSSAEAFTQALRNGKVDVSKIRVTDNTGHGGPAGA
ncbi:MAG: hypothetical protein J0M34_02855 [Alphaproteobacteria bacterium]|nr:hypothetical protein [Alphaproteobacteria bacterium]